MKRDKKKLADLFNQAQLQADRFGKRKNITKGTIEMKLEREEMTITSILSTCPCPWPHPTNQNIRIKYNGESVFYALYSCFYSEVGYMPNPEGLKVTRYKEGDWEQELFKKRIKL